MNTDGVHKTLAKRSKFTKLSTYLQQCKLIGRELGTSKVKYYIGANLVVTQQQVYLVAVSLLMWLAITGIYQEASRPFKCDSVYGRGTSSPTVANAQVNMAPIIQLSY